MLFSNQKVIKSNYCYESQLKKINCWIHELAIKKLKVHYLPVYEYCKIYNCA